MTFRNSNLCILGFVLLVVACAASILASERHGNAFLLNCATNEDAVIRWFYNPPGDYFHFPLIFRAVGQEDRRLDTAPMTTEGRTAYISFMEMRQLLETLADTNLSWKESEKTETLTSYKKIPVLDSMEILVLCPKGSARGNISPKNICDTLAPLDSALKTPRALWEFQLFRHGYGCDVSGFNFQAYPDHSH